MSVIPTAAKVEAGWLNKKEMAASLGISTQAFDKWDVAPVAKVGRSVYYTAADVVANRLSKTQKKAQPKPAMSSGDGPKVFDSVEAELEYEKLLLTRAQRQGQELKNDENQQLVVPTDFAAFALSKVAAEGAGVMASVPLNMKRKHPEMSPVQQATMERELAKGMNALSQLAERVPELAHEFNQQSNR